MGNVADIMLHLHEMFGTKTRSAKVKAINAFKDLKQKPEELVRDYMLKVISCLNEAELNGVEIDAKKQISMIVHSLNSSFSQFKLDYELHTRDYTLSGLMNDLQNMEEVLDLKKKPEAHAISTSKPKPKGKKKIAGNKKISKGLVGAKKKPMKKKTASKDNTNGKCFHCGVKGHWKRNCKVYLEEIQKNKQDSGATNHVCNSLQGFQQRRKLSKGQFRMRMANGTFVSALVVRAIILQFPYGHINQNRLNRLIKDGTLPNMVECPLLVCESCIEAKMTKGPFKAKGNKMPYVLNLVHTNVCGPMNVEAREGYEYFITFIDDYSRHGFVYLMHRKSESFEKCKEFKAEVEKQLGKPLKQLRSDQGGKYLSDEFKQYLTDNGIISNLSMPRTPQHNGGYCMQTTQYLLNFAPSKAVLKTPRELWTGRKSSIRHLQTWGCPTHVLKLESPKMEPKTKVCLFVGYPKGTKGYYFYSDQDKKVFVSMNATFLEEEFVRNHKPKSEIVLKELSDLSDVRVNSEDVITLSDSRVETETQLEHQIVVLRCSGRVVRQPERYMGLGENMIALSNKHEYDPITYKEAINDVDAEEWHKAMKSELDSMDSNKVWTLVDPPERIKPVRCKWIYKIKRGSDGKVETFKARLVAKGFTQRKGINYEETFSPVAMLKSIRILLSITAHLDHEIWQMDVKTAFLNRDLEERIYMARLKGFIKKGHEHKVCELHMSIYGLKQASRSWNIRFDTAIKSYDFQQNVDEPCVYKKIQDKKVISLVLHVDDILLIGNDIGMLSIVKGWLNHQFNMKDLGEASYVLRIKLIRDRKNKQIALSQASYIDKILAKFAMLDSKKGFMPSRHGIKLSKEMSPKTPEEVEYMRRIPYASAIGTLMYAMLCTRPNICYAIGLVSRFYSNPDVEHWTTVKCFFKYLRRTKNYMLGYSRSDLVATGYTDSDFQSDVDFRKSTSGSVFTIGGGAIVWRSVKQSCIANSTMEAEYVAACEAAKEAVWLRKFLMDSEVIPDADKPITLYCDNSGAVANSKESRNHKVAKHIERKYHLIREIIQRGEVLVKKIPIEKNLVDPFTKTLTQKSFDRHLEGFGMRDMSYLL
ncbi:Integrase [Theobroma cacao]|nr:Integrase [Theobroma cacao]